MREWRIVKLNAGREYEFLPRNDRKINRKSNETKRASVCTGKDCDLCETSRIFRLYAIAIANFPPSARANFCLFVRLLSFVSENLSAER